MPIIKDIIIIENNTKYKYIDSLFVIFYYLYEYIDKNIKENNRENIDINDNYLSFFYKDFINNNIFKFINSDKAICNKTLASFINNYIILENKNFNEFITIIDFIDLFIKIYNIKQMKIKKNINIPLISITKELHTVNTTINNIINDWFYDFMQVFNNNIDFDMPLLLIIYIDRLINKKNRIDINETLLININKVDIYYKCKSILCYNSTIHEYYALINTNDIWYIYKNNAFPNIVIANMNDNLLYENVITQSILFFYYID